MTVLHRDTDSKTTIPPQERILLSEEDACTMFSLSRPTFRDFVAAGYLHPVELPGGIRRRLYRRADLEAFAAKLAAQ